MPITLLIARQSIQFYFLIQGFLILTIIFDRVFIIINLIIFYLFH